MNRTTAIVSLLSTLMAPFVAPASAQATLELTDFLVMPMTGVVEGKGSNAVLLARVNTLREEVGGARRLFISDLNGPLYIFDKESKKLSVYLDFNGSAGRNGIFRKLTIEQGYGNGLNGFFLDPEYHTKRQVLHHAHRGSGAARLGPSEQRGVPRAEGRGLHDDHGRQDSWAAAERGCADSVDRFEPVECDVRGHGA